MYIFFGALTAVALFLPIVGFWQVSMKPEVYVKPRILPGEPDEE